MHRKRLRRHDQNHMVGQGVRSQYQPARWRRHFRCFDRSKKRHNTPYSPVLTVVPLFLAAMVGSGVLANLVS